LGAEQLVDLHAHTNRSDGLLEPADLVTQAAQAGLAAIAVTDHDTTAGIRLAQTGADTLPALRDCGQRCFVPCSVVHESSR